MTTEAEEVEVDEEVEEVEEEEEESEEESEQEKSMPKLGNKHYAYTAKGKAAYRKAKAAQKKKGK